MPDVVFVFEVHQPRRIRREIPYNVLLDSIRSRLSVESLEKYIFNSELDRLVVERASKRCYIPANNIILNAIEEFKRGSKRFKVSYSISGVFLEQCEKWAPEVIESFRALASTGMVEFIEQTFYHSLASLLSEPGEFIEQLKMHREIMKDILGVEPLVAENTEFIYNNRIAWILNNLGYKAVLTEGVERVLWWRSPNYVYKAWGCELRVLMRNYRLSDDIGFRFSDRNWSEYPLTAGKYAAWVSATPGDIIVIAMDYETFGEHHWPESGIHDFLYWLPRELLKWDNVETITPSEAVEKHEVKDEIDVPEWGTISWADERDLSAWLGNEMQQRCFKLYQELEAYVKALGDPTILRIWRLLGVSDHYYYMATKRGATEEVHSYFSPHKSPILSYQIYLTSLTLLVAILSHKINDNRIKVAKRLRVDLSRAFQFFEKPGKPVGIQARSLIELLNAIEIVPEKSIRYHVENRDLQKWLTTMFGLEDVSAKLDELIGLEEANFKEKVIEIIRNSIIRG